MTNRVDLIDEPLTEEQLQEIPQPYAELLNHVALKGVQAGSIGGIIVGSGMLAYRRPSVTAIQALHKLGIGGVKGALWTTVGGIAAMNIILYREGFNQYRIWDRAYRLKHNASQQRCDKMSLTGAAIGATVGAALSFVSPSLSLIPAALSGAAFGITGGIIGHVATYPYTSTESSVKAGVKAIETNAKEMVQSKNDSKGS